MVTENDFLLVYASQTGQAKAIAEEFNEAALYEGLSPRLHCISQSEKEFFLEKESCVVFIVSTTGDGEPPETALKFWRKIKRSALSKDHFAHLTFTVLGLGDSNYTNFCNFGKMLNRRLEELGARHFFASAWADDGTGLEVVVEPWKDDALNGLKQHLTTQNLNECLDNKNATFDTLIDNVKDEFRNSCSISLSQTNNNSTETENQTNVNLSNVTSVDLEEQQNSNIVIIQSLSTVSVDDTVADNKRSFNMETELKTDEVKMAAIEPVLHSLTISNMSDIPLTLPLCPHRYLKLTFIPDANPEDAGSASEKVFHNGCPYPGARSSVSWVTINAAKQLTHDKAAKTTIQLDLDISSCDWSYEPGDTIAVICPNDAIEVNSLIQRLNLDAHARSICCLETLPDTRKKNAQVPEFLPQKSTLFELLQTCLEIRETPKKVFLRALVDFTEDAVEKRRLQELCSKQGSDDFAKFVRGPNLSTMDILAAFPSCQPPIEVILENLPRLQPRAYSASSSLLRKPGNLQFVFNILHFAGVDGRCGDRDGVCTGWLDRITRQLQNQDLPAVTENQSNNEPLKVPIFLRTNRFFHLPSDLSVPLVMIGPGTGVAPFIGFLQHRSHLVSETADPVSVGETWLFYGCRHKELDFLFKEELERFVSDGVLTKLHVSHSRDPSQPKDSPRYVQDNMKQVGQDLIGLIHDRNAKVYICGDAKGMAVDVYSTFRSLLQLHKDMDSASAENYLKMMRDEKRYLEDVWV